MVGRLTQFPQVGFAFHAVSCLSHSHDRWDQHAYQHDDDRNDHQEFNQGESATAWTKQGSHVAAPWHASNFSYCAS
jgi:hypothetical protein